jgi:hypothetical protein
MRVPSLVLVFAALSCAPMLPAQQVKPAAAAATVNTIDGARLVDIRELKGTTYHVQGMDLDAAHLWVTSVDIEHKRGFVHQFNRRTGQFERQVEVTDGERFHPGGISVSGDSIWVPVAEYRPHSSAEILELDKKTLAVKRKVVVKDHIGCVAVVPEGLLAGNWSSKQLYLLDKAGRQTRVVNNDAKTQYQDMKFVNGELVTSGNLDHTSGTIDWYTWPEMKLVRSLHAGSTDRGRPLTVEAMSVKGKNLYLVPEDGPSRLFHFVLEKP